jgi:hypothetical protein
MSRIRLAVTVLLAGAALVAAPLSAQARPLPVNYDFATGALAGFGFPQTPPPGADNFGCKPPSALDPAHPVRVPCLIVLPITGPVGPVPSFQSRAS